MTSFTWRLLGIVARGIEPAQRDAFLGDIAESGEGTVAAFRDVLGHILRRQAVAWISPGPWVALIGVAVVAGLPLSRIAFVLNADVAQQWMTYQKYGVHFETGLPFYQDALALLCVAAGIVLWSWAGGFAVGSFSGRSAWLTSCVCYLVVLHAAWIGLVLSGNLILSGGNFLRMLAMIVMAHGIAIALFTLPFFWGVILGVRRLILPLRAASFLGAAALLMAILITWESGWHETAHEVWSEGVWPGVSWTRRVLPYLAASLPAAYIAAASYFHKWKEEEPG